MSYTIELWGLRLADLTAELRRGRPDVRSLSVDGSNSSTDYETLSREVAMALEAGERMLTDEQAAYVADVGRLLGVHLGSLAYSSSGGAKLRDCLSRGAATAGSSEMFDKIFDRGLDGISTSGYPGFGWLSVDELQVVPELDVRRSSDPECQTWTATLARALPSARDRSLDILAIHT